MSGLTDLGFGEGGEDSLEHVEFRATLVGL